VKGLYVHVPFCVSKCAYCDFYSLADRLDLVPSYVDAVLAEARRHAGLSFETLYLGGGTPSLLEAASLRRLVEGLGQAFDLSHVAEATVEVNPETASGEWLGAALELGFHRLSVGVQSLSDGELRRVGRVHSAEQAVEAVSRAVGMRFRDVSADVIVGLPGQGYREHPAPLHYTLERLISLGVGHLSVYCLSLEPGTPLALDPPGDLPSEDAQASLFEASRSVLEGKGFIHYEISNFCRPGRECRHNVNYWRGGEYLGLGPAAASHLGGRRWKNRADLPGYLRHPGAAVEELEQLGPKEKAAEEAMLRLRLLAEGLAADEMVSRFGEEAMQGVLSRLDGLTAEGLLVREGNRYRLAPSRVLTSNPILARVLA
jgi:oxygen-independent coproporphyrinogen-3 oxidase